MSILIIKIGFFRTTTSAIVQETGRGL